MIMSTLIQTDRFVLSETERSAIEHEMHHYEDPRAASIEALKIVQKERGWVPDGAADAIGAILGIPASDVEGVATFYSQIFRQPVGRHVIRVCDSMTCYVGGHESVVAEMQKQLGIGLGQTTTDNRFTLLPVCCLGNCDKAPAVMIDDDTFGDVQPDGVSKLLEAYQ
ncbi:NADH-quinone oxidoreductase subunit NuoE [Pseudomonas sp. JM0905a]|uniref:NADH-quinone oxidoreductase subunit E n=1 Tax=Metapseudomonas resinovorans TaxID=53412 RepID=A0ABT4Y6M0_METRE|nr:MULTISPECIES: NADH-quinone oxidoreductase subunit NuoE [Pseudomonas]MBD2839637.1 NADH-quinone oxidoreductase subunit NuoE [Pseudomonas sp. JM0905a]MDA8484406.1 NADH-quinone oxidoreductase subunit NuoE [Pseudomonas resinovorans]UCP00925.1 NADH-quinone oxidoreductase subunit NuoE [Pseudomonas lalkuanensis]